MSDRHWKPGILLHFSLDGGWEGSGVSGRVGDCVGLQQTSSDEVHIPVKDDILSVLEHPCKTIYM